MKKLLFAVLVLGSLVIAGIASAEGCYTVSINGQFYFCCELAPGYTDCQKL